MGISSEDALGVKWDTIAAPEDRPRFVTRLTDDPIAAGKQWKRFEIPLPGPIDRIVLVTAKPLLDGDGGIVGWVGALADVTAASASTRPPRRGTWPKRSTAASSRRRPRASG